MIHCSLSIRRGVTLIELLVVMGVIGILAALLLPAVQAARETSRRVVCASRLRQVALANQAYAAQHGLFPNLLPVATHTPPGALPPLIGFSVFTALLPHLDQSPLYHATNFEAGCWDPHWYFGGKLHPASEANRTSMTVGVDTFLCPSDRARERIAWTAGGNLRGNGGTGRWYVRTNGPFSVFAENAGTADVVDGLSQTVAFSEHVRGMGTAVGVDPRRVALMGMPGMQLTTDETVAACGRLTAETTPLFSLVGSCWFAGSYAQTIYNHISVPNSPIPDCLSSEGNIPPPGIVPPRSDHPGGVQAAMADGSVRWVSNSIDRAVWRAVGSRNGGEAVGLDSQ